MGKKTKPGIPTKQFQMNGKSMKWLCPTTSDVKIWNHHPTDSQALKIDSNSRFKNITPKPNGKQKHTPWKTKMTMENQPFENVSPTNSY